MGDNETAQQIYESLTRGDMGVFKAAPKGVPPVGGSNVPQPGEAIPVKENPVTPINQGLRGLRMEVALLRQEIKELMDVLRSL